MTALTDPEKREIVMRLARFETVGEIVADFRQRGLHLHHKQVGGYDPTKSYFDAGDWARELFNGTRRIYLEDVEAVPIANKAFRLNQLDELLRIAKQARNWKLAAELIEQASKEASGADTNSRDVNINDVRGRARDHTVEERAAMLAALVREEIEKMDAPRAEATHPTKQ